MQNLDKSNLLGLLLLPIYTIAQDDFSNVIQNINNRLNILESKAKNTKGVINLKSANTTMILGGSIQLDTIYLLGASGKSGGSNSSDNFFNANNIPTAKTGENAELTLSARNSKFWIKTRTASTNQKPLLTLLEIDFWGSNSNEKNSNSYNIRLRHAYINYLGWTLGQTNSAFRGSGIPSTLRAPVDDIFVRQPVIRYTKSLPLSSFSISLEQPESVIMVNDGTKITVNDDKVPDLILHYQYYGLWGEWSFALLCRELRIDQEQNLEMTDTVFGYGMQFSSKIHTFENDNISFGIVGGNGVGRYFATSFFPGATIDENQKLTAQFSWGSHIAYQHWWHKNFQTNIAYGFVHTNNNLILGDIDKEAWSSHVGLRYTPVPNFMLGLEYIHAKRVYEDDTSYTLNRFYLQTGYTF